MIKFTQWKPNTEDYVKMMFEFKVQKEENTLPHNNTHNHVENTSKTKMDISYILN